MKTRQGFVSNSSTSSFIAVGIHFKKTKLADELMDTLDDNDLSYEDDYNGGYYVFNELASWDDSDGMATVSVEEHLKDVEKAMTDLGKVFPDKVNEIKIHYGVRAS